MATFITYFYLRWVYSAINAASKVAPNLAKSFTNSSLVVSA
ncbi:hypothetical protein AALB_3990 [Agarivorans albus MKT 106]|uniref:Uncharacterized protein n=1 Tax=Agarivorans albus MKT 106 TaxID=1331007 RepID=R9PRJ1_AGAAL|nr:hypothetical protein AALB_3990 [Agarivorans albus MKT 106]